VLLLLLLRLFASRLRHVPLSQPHQPAHVRNNPLPHQLFGPTYLKPTTLQAVRTGSNRSLRSVAAVNVIRAAPPHPSPRDVPPATAVSPHRIRSYPSSPSAAAAPRAMLTPRPPLHSPPPPLSPSPHLPPHMRRPSIV
jgi:hypothetical protein